MSFYRHNLALDIDNGLSNQFDKPPVNITHKHLSTSPDYPHEMIVNQANRRVFMPKVLCHFLYLNVYDYAVIDTRGKKAMLISEFKVKGKAQQYEAINEAIRTVQFVHNKCFRYWIDNRGATKFDLNKYCAVLAKEFDFAKQLNSLKISRQRKGHACKLARSVITSNDVVVYEDLRVSNLVKNHCLAKSINDAGWYQFRVWMEYFAKVFGRLAIAVNPAYTSQECSDCGVIVKKSLSTRTHVCQCGCKLDRDHNAAINILNKGLNTLGHKEIYAWGEMTSTVVGAILP